MQRHLHLIFIAFMLSFGGALCAQNSTSSPYSRYAFGELSNYCPTGYRAMGGVRYGMRNNRTINAAQPASYTACDSMTFMFDLSAFVAWNRQQDGSGMRNKALGNLDYITMQFPLWKQHIAMSLGILPYSMVGYDITLPGSVTSPSGTYTYSRVYAGEGGITDLYGGLSGNLFDWVALGLNAYYMFGEVSNARTLIFDDGGLASVIRMNDIHVSTLRLRGGIQVFHTFGKHSFVVGGVYEHRMNVRGTYTELGTSTVTDSVEYLENSGMQLPSMLGVGGSYIWNNRLTVAVDYERQFWGSLHFLEDQEFGRETLTDYNRISLGAEYRHNPYGKNYAERMYWRAGCGFNDSYVKTVKSKDLNVSIGMGFPMRTSATIFNITLEYKRRGLASGLHENGLMLTFGASVRENWFFKRKL